MILTPEISQNLIKTKNKQTVWTLQNLKCTKNMCEQQVVGYISSSDNNNIFFCFTTVKVKEEIFCRRSPEHILLLERKIMLILVYIYLYWKSLPPENIPGTPYCHTKSFQTSSYKKVLYKFMYSAEFSFSIPNTLFPFPNDTSCAPMPTFMDRKALSRGPYRVIWESGESSSSTWSLSGGSSEGSRGRRVEAVGDEITLSAVFCEGRSTDNIVSSISDTWEQTKEENRFWSQVRLLIHRILQTWTCINYKTFCSFLLWIA